MEFAFLIFSLFRVKYETKLRFRKELLSKKEPELDNLENCHPVAKNGNDMIQRQFKSVAGQTLLLEQLGMYLRHQINHIRKSRAQRWNYKKTYRETPLF